MESLLAGMAPDAGDDDPAHRAQMLIYEAWETPDPGQRLALAREALQVSPDCADGWVMLAENAATDLEEAAGYYRKGVEAGERALGEQAFHDDVGHFWGILETRPYMRARAGLAMALERLERLERPEEALAHYRELLRLNPGDNLGVRYVLLRLLMVLERNDETGELLDQFDEEATATWDYGRALLSFRNNGPSEAADEALAHALHANRFVPAYLLGRRRIPKTLPDYVGFGDENEALCYAAEFKDCWRQTRGALDWLKSALASN